METVLARHTSRLSAAVSCQCLTPSGIETTSPALSSWAGFLHAGYRLWTENTNEIFPFCQVSVVERTGFRSLMGGTDLVFVRNVNNFFDKTYL